MELIDIHSHYAWDIDDGIANLNDAKEALTKAKKQNINVEDKDIESFIDKELMILSN